MDTRNKAAVAALVLLMLAAVVLFWKFVARPPSTSPSGPPPAGNSGAAWMTFNGENLVIPVSVCGKTVSNVAVDTGSAKLVVFGVDPVACGVAVEASPESLPYGSMTLSAASSTAPVAVTLGDSVALTLPTVYFAKSCDSGDCPPGLLGLMAKEAGGTFPDHDFSLSFDGSSGGWLALDPSPPAVATRMPFDTSYRGFYTIHGLTVVDASGVSHTMSAVVDSGTTLCEFSPASGVNIRGSVRIYAPGASTGEAPLLTLDSKDMDTSDSVGEAFPSQTFVLGLPFFRGRHVAFSGTGVIAVF